MKPLSPKLGPWLYAKRHYFSDRPRGRYPVMRIRLSPFAYVGPRKENR